MNYQNVLEFFKSSSSVVNVTQAEYAIPQLASISLVIPQSSTVRLQHTAISGDQKIYIEIGDHAICFLESFATDLQQQGTLEFHIVLKQYAQLSMNIGFLHPVESCSISIYLQGAESKADVFGLYALSGEQRAVIKTYQYHYAPRTKSNVLFKGMLSGSSKASYTGLIKLDHLTQGACAEQENKNILLSSQASVISVPSIEVLQHDVQCFHGTAIGKFLQDDIWYLQSKGLSLSQIYEMLTQCFFVTVVDGYHNKDRIMELICKKIL